MFTLVLLSLLGTGLAYNVPPSAKYATNIPDEAYVLPGTSYPTFYDVRLFLDPGNHDFFTGDVTIRLFPTVNTSTIVLHAMAMNITKIGLYDALDENVDILESSNIATDDTHFLTVRSKVELNIMRPYHLKIEYIGSYATNMFGIYVSTYERPNIGTV
ncbi:jg5003 [Pararge aegeria aegeria]|uniref:Jg5003 protein n=2 Tax=Pararge aegeria TaxID=116150 RepID=A0A8S4QCW4_9NEOP|nr:jg5003 [Pararge aegeria aegeria]